ncbi:MAG: hypothetical protein ACI9XO_002542 [Paraglaciecola sp.]|jgi:hypothetical protein
MESQTTHTSKEGGNKRSLLSGFDKLVLIIILLIVAYFVSSKIGMPMKTVEEKIEWVD